MAEDSKRLMLIDGHAMLYRAFFAYPQSLTTRSGELINAVYGFTNILLSVVKDLKPTHLAVSFDVGETFRHKEYPEYKAHREKMPDELKSQEPRAYEVVTTLNIPLYTKEGFEADDVIGTLSRQGATENHLPVLIVTGDMDAMQLVREAHGDDEEVHVFVPGRGQKPALEYGVEQVKHKYQLTPKQIIDLKALAGDSSDNIPGIYGIGQKTATTLLNTFGSVEGIYEYLKERDTKSDEAKEAVLKPAMLKRLTEGKESAYESKKLATIVTDVPLELDVERAQVQQYDKVQATKLFEELEFRSLMSKLPNDSYEESVQEALF